MASALLFSLIILVASSSVAQKTRSHHSILLPVAKDLYTRQYVSRLFQGNDPIAPSKVVLDLGGPFLWLASPSFRPLHCASLQCSRAKANSTCFSGTCTLTTVNALTGAATTGELVEDILAFDATSDRKSSITSFDRFLFSCAPPLLLTGLASHAKGMLGLGRGRIGLPSQLAAALGEPRRFALCLSSSSGALLAGNRPEISLSVDQLWGSLTYTPLIPNPIGTREEYYITIKSIKVNGRRLSLSLNSRGTARLSTIDPYSSMESSIYDTFVKAYTTAAAAVNMTLVNAVPPFGVCFGSNGIGETPAIELALQSEMVKWKILGRNAMVQVSDGVTCLGFLDGGVNNGASIVLGGHQLEDNLLDFDLGTSMLGFTSLLTTQRSCSEFGLGSEDW